MKRTLYLLIFLSAILTSCNQTKVQRFAGEALGTYYAITYVGSPNDGLQHQVDSILAKVSAEFSIFDSASIVSRINRNEDVELPKDFSALTNKALEISRNTGGAFDITVGPLVNLWGFGKEEPTEVTQQVLDSVREFVGYQKITVGEDGRIVKSDNRIELNFNAIAKGEAVDRVARFLVEAGYKNCLVDIGGEVRCEGKKVGNQKWVVGVQIPTETKEGMIESDYPFELSGKSVATSGNYRNYKEVDGLRYNHITDPRSGECRSTNLMSVSVIADECAVADAYATAFMVMGIQESLEFLKSHKEISAHFIYYEKGRYQYIQTPNFPKK